MHNVTSRSIVAVAILITAVSPVWSAGKITSDPNMAPKAELAAPEPLWKTDPRLDKKIEYDAAGARLHRVTSDLAEMSGVAVLSGKDDSDWRTRDIPVTVASRGTALKDLFEYIAYSTHTILTAKKTDKGIVYRFLLDPAVRSALESYERRIAESSKEYMLWNVGVARQLKDIPLSQITPPKGASSDWWDRTACAVEASKLLAAMDKKMLDAVANGEIAWLTPRTATGGMREAIVGFLRATDQGWVTRVNRDNVRSRQTAVEQGITHEFEDIEPASATDIENSRVRISVSHNDIVIDGAVLASAAPDNQARRWSNHNARSVADLVRSDLKRGQEIWKTVPPYREFMTVKPLAGDAKRVTGPMPEITENVCIKQGEDKKRLAMGDALIALSKQTGRTIVCEDFLSHQEWWDFADRFTSEMPLTWVLTKELVMNWFLDTRTKALVAYDNGWFGRHATLIPENIIDNLVTKINGDGAELDDLTPVAEYPEFAMVEWRPGNGGPAPWASYTDQETKPFWRFYNSLSAAQKARVRGENGLLLGKRDISLIERWLKNRTSYSRETLFATDDQRPVEERLLSPEVRPTLVLRMDAQISAYPPPFVRLEDLPAVPADKAEELNRVQIPESFTNRHRYALVLEGTEGSDKISVNVSAGYELPFYSQEREKILLEALQKQREANR